MKEIPKRYMKLFANKNALISVDKQDIEEILKLGSELRMKPKKEKLAKGGIFFIEGNKKLTIDKLNKYCEKVTSKCCTDAKIVWGAAIKNNLKTTKITAFYVY